MASAGHPVWVGFIDGLPVVGSVKEAVEWVLAVAANDSLQTKLKLKAINERLAQKSKYDGYSRSSSGYASDSTWAGYSSDSSTSSGFSSGKSARHDTMHVQSVPDVNLKAYITEVAKGKKSQQTAKPPVKSKADQKKLQEIRDETLRKIHQINQNFKFNNPLEDHGNRARRGEHVINNDVITFYHKAVDDFMKDTYFMPNTLAIRSPVDDATREAIQGELVVHFDEHELYINANALIYGEYSRVLKQALKRWLLEPTQEVGEDVTRIVQIMNHEQAYVDWLARDKYIGNQNAKRVRVEAIRERVVTMFTNWLQYFQAAKTGINALIARR